MNTTDLTALLRFTQPLHLDATILCQEITRPFFATPRGDATHDMLLLNAHNDLLAEPAPLRDLTFFDLDRP